jgi:hypothetical protein
VAEVIHQLDEGEAAFATLAVVIATAHAGTAAIAAGALRTEPAVK